MTPKKVYCSLVMVAGICCVAAGTVSAQRQPDAPVDIADKRGVPTRTESADANKLRLDVSEFRRAAPSLSDESAANQWLRLWDRAIAHASSRTAPDYAAIGAADDGGTGLRSVLNALPGPSAWPALRQKAAGRAQSKSADTAAMGLQLITEMLTGDKAAVFQSVDKFERTATAVAHDERKQWQLTLNRARAVIYKLYGSREQIAESFALASEAHAQISRDMPLSHELDVPDLVGLVGPTKAEALVRAVLQKPVSLRVPEGEATRTLARQLTLSEIKKLANPQWSLVDGIGTAPLYEALQRRFDGIGGFSFANFSWSKMLWRILGKVTGVEHDYSRQRADTYYFLDLVIAGRHADAERHMARITGGLSLPRQAMTALVRAGKNEAVYAFLEKLLERKPEMQGWDAYLEQAAYLGRAKNALALLDTILKRTNLPAQLRAELQGKRLDALLGADQIDLAVTAFQELLAAPPAANDAKLSIRIEAAIRLATLGRVLKQPKLAQTGFEFARKAVAMQARSKDYRSQKNIISLMAELRRQDRADEAQAIAKSEIDRASSEQSVNALSDSFMPDTLKRTALTELAGIHDAAKQYPEVLRLFNEHVAWGVRDLRIILVEKDSLGTPLGMMAARALKASGNTVAAKAVVSALLDQMPGHDPAYRLLVELSSGQALAELDRLYALDQFQERPLIWKAIVLHSARQYAQAEAAIRRAVAIDPSDGEQGRSDRMRAYAVLADVLESKGDLNSARLYRRAVAAIRLSEQADELHQLGLYQRAFAGYRAALAEFSDAYCIQSRLAVQLSKQGAHDEALKHYRRAYELMPDSFGRVESHCFGCESVFADKAAQTIAEQTFTEMMKRSPAKPQVHYMLGYLRKDQGRYGDALPHFRQAVTLDAQYLNAWKHLHELGEKTYLEPWERDIARLKLFELDPRQRHVRYELKEIVDLASLRRALDRNAGGKLNPASAQVYPLAGSARTLDQSLASLPPSSREQAQQMAAIHEQLADSSQQQGRTMPTLGQHALLNAALELMENH